MTIWKGCHGVRLAGDIGDWGSCTRPPVLDAQVAFAAVADPQCEPLWVQRTVVDGEVIERSLHRHTDGQFVVAGSRGTRMSVDTRTNQVIVDDGPPFVQRQLVAAIALPLLLHRRRVLVVHGAAIARDGKAVVICGVSGAGKSSSMVALYNAGWTPLSEDVCSITVDGERALVWPGPPWVRVLHGEPEPLDAALLSERGEKKAFSIASRLASDPLPIERVVLLDSPGGDQAEDVSLAAGNAIGAIEPHAVWLTAPEDRSAALFPLLAALVTRVGASRLRLPREAAWRDRLRDTLEQPMSTALQDS